jgi:hypothetical protein
MSRDDLTPEQLARFRKVFPPGFTQALYTATDHPTTDGTVKVVSSAYHIWNFFVNIVGLPAKAVHVAHLPYDGHADVGATAPRVRGWIHQNSTQQEVLAEGRPANP